jgi:hypothetical protein
MLLCNLRPQFLLFIIATLETGVANIAMPVLSANCSAVTAQRGAQVWAEDEVEAHT